MFGATRAASGATSTLGFTGQQTDAETGFVFLRARYLNPSLGRFTTVDSVQPNAPGTQGFNLYAYVANNPTTWVDPSGHMSAVAAGVLLSEAGQACLTTGWCEEVLLPLLARVSVGRLIGIGGGAGIAFIVLACVLNDECRGKMVEFAEMVAGNGSEKTGPVTTPSGGEVGLPPGAGGQTAAPLPPFPPKGPGGNGYCLSEVSQITGADVQNVGGADGVETWTFKSPSGHDWEVKIKREGATSMNEQPGPRISLQDKTRANTPNTPSYWDPDAGTWRSASARR